MKLIGPFTNSSASPPVEGTESFPFTNAPAKSLPSTPGTTVPKACLLLASVVSERSTLKNGPELRAVTVTTPAPLDTAI